jgi:hypothetical protein
MDEVRCFFFCKALKDSRADFDIFWFDCILVKGQSFANFVQKSAFTNI